MVHFTLLLITCGFLLVAGQASDLERREWTTARTKTKNETQYKLPAGVKSNNITVTRKSEELTVVIDSPDLNASLSHETKQPTNGSKVATEEKLSNYTTQSGKDVEQVTVKSESGKKASSAKPDAIGKNPTEKTKPRDVKRQGTTPIPSATKKPSTGAPAVTKAEIAEGHPTTVATPIHTASGTTTAKSTVSGKQVSNSTVTPETSTRNPKPTRPAISQPKNFTNAFTTPLPLKPGSGMGSQGAKNLSLEMAKPEVKTSTTTPTTVEPSFYYDTVSSNDYATAAPEDYDSENSFPPTLDEGDLSTKANQTNDLIKKRIEDIIEVVPQLPEVILPNKTLLKFFKDPEEKLLDERISQIARQLAETSLRKQYEEQKLGHGLPISLRPIDGHSSRVSYLKSLKIDKQEKHTMDFRPNPQAMPNLTTAKNESAAHGDETSSGRPVQTQYHFRKVSNSVSAKQERHEGLVQYMGNQIINKSKNGDQDTGEGTPGKSKRESTPGANDQQMVTEAEPSSTLAPPSQNQKRILRETKQKLFTTVPDKVSGTAEPGNAETSTSRVQGNERPENP